MAWASKQNPYPLRVDRAPPKGGAALFAVALEGWGLGAVTPSRQYRSASRRQGRIGLAQC